AKVCAEPTAELLKPEPWRAQPDDRDLEPPAPQEPDAEERLGDRGAERREAVARPELREHLLRLTAEPFDLGAVDPGPARPAGRLLGARDADELLVGAQVVVQVREAPMLAARRRVVVVLPVLEDALADAEHRLCACGHDLGIRDARVITAPQLRKQQLPRENVVRWHRCPTPSGSDG